MGKTQYIPMHVVADRYKVSTAAVQAWCRKGQIPCVKTPGGRYRIPRDTFEAFYASNSVVEVGAGM